MSMDYAGAQDRTEAETLLDDSSADRPPAALEPSRGGRECAGGAEAASGRPLRLACAFALLAAAAVAVGATAERSRHTRRRLVHAVPALRMLQDDKPCRSLLTLSRPKDQGPGGLLGLLQGALGGLIGGAQDPECTSEGEDDYSSDCSPWGENCVGTGCCKEQGHQCYRKNISYGKCLPSCVPDAPNLFEDAPGKWTCGPVGVRTPGEAKPRVVERVPRWVPMTCARSNFDCSASKCCSEPGQQCYEQAGGIGRCRDKCGGPDEVEDKFDGGAWERVKSIAKERALDWTCKLLGPGPPQDHSGGSNKSSAACSEDGDDCGISTCCKAPGTTCYVKNLTFAQCLASCPPPPDFSQSSFQPEPWNCAPIGPRAPGEAVVKPAKDVAWNELPSWVSTLCSSKTENCASTACCKDPEMQCYEQEAGKATCRPLCLEGMVEDGRPWTCQELGVRSPNRCPECSANKGAAPTVVIPFFERDLCKLKYTAKSISVNDPHKFLGDIMLMWISSRHTWEFQDQIDEIVNILKDTRQVRVEDFTDRMQSAYLSGWFTQQLVKLKVASVVETDYYVVLDSKNTIMHPLEEDPFFTSCGQAIIQAEWPAAEILEPHIDWYDRSAHALGVKSPKSSGEWDETLLWPASITPMVMHTRSVLDMLDHLGEGAALDRLCDGSLCDTIGAKSKSGHGATEFTLYTLYVYNMIDSGRFECIHSIEPVLGFKKTYSENWYSELQSSIVKAGLTVKMSQLVVSNKDGWPVLWSPDEGNNSVPEENEWPLMFTDCTRKWSAAIWRGEAEDAERLVKENLRTLSLIQKNATKMFPLTFGAQPASLEMMSGEQKERAIADITALYDEADLMAGTKEQDFIGCVVGYVN